MKKILLILSLFLSTYSFGQIENKITDKQVKEYTKRITGVFSTLEQHKSDSTFDDVVVYTKLIRRDFNNVYWIYTEQGEAKNYKPYRQRVYQIAEVWGRILQRIYYINDASKYSYFKPETIESITTDDIKLKPGCDLIIQLNDNVYSSQTEDKNCVATFRGSTYTTTDFKVYKDAVHSWERGWNNKDEQVWGSRKGHYIYKKISKK